MEKHTKKLIRLDLQVEHKKFCHAYRGCKIEEDAQSMFVTIWALWYSNGATTKKGLRELNDWLGFWHFCFQQWGESMKEVNLFGLQNSLCAFLFCL
jgi:hypothetical protein